MARVPIVLRWRQEVSRPVGTSLRSSIFSFIDTAGEDLNELETAFSLRYLESCDAFIVVLDPFMMPGARARANIPSAAVQGGENVPIDVLARVTELLRTQHRVKAKRKIKVPLAVVFPKIDAFYDTIDRTNPIMSEAPGVPAYDEADGQAVHEHLLALLHSWNADDIDTYLRLNYEEYRFFAVSALGEQPHYDEGRANDGGVRPHRVADPILWLLSRTGGVPRR
jgi:hypothetical protein